MIKAVFVALVGGLLGYGFGPLGAFLLAPKFLHSYVRPSLSLIPLAILIAVVFSVHPEWILPRSFRKPDEKSDAFTPSCQACVWILCPIGRTDSDPPGPANNYLRRSTEDLLALMILSTLPLERTFPSMDFFPIHKAMRPHFASCDIKDSSEVSSTNSIHGSILRAV